MIFSQYSYHYSVRKENLATDLTVMKKEVFVMAFIGLQIVKL